MVRKIKKYQKCEKVHEIKKVPIIWKIIDNLKKYTSKFGKKIFFFIFGKKVPKMRKLLYKSTQTLKKWLNWEKLQEKKNQSFKKYQKLKNIKKYKNFNFTKS